MNNFYPPPPPTHTHTHTHTNTHTNWPISICLLNGWGRVSVYDRTHALFEDLIVSKPQVSNLCTALQFVRLYGSSIANRDNCYIFGLNPDDMAPCFHDILTPNRISPRWHVVQVTRWHWRRLATSMGGVTIIMANKLEPRRKHHMLQN